MSTEPGTPSIPQLETTTIPPKKVWFDPIGIRYISNSTRNTVIVHFSHNVRAIEVIDIAEPPEENTNTEAVEALKGEVIEEEVY